MATQQSCVAIFDSICVHFRQQRGYHIPLSVKSFERGRGGGLFEKVLPRRILTYYSSTLTISTQRGGMRTVKVFSLHLTR